MANSIALFRGFTTMLDEVYKGAGLTSVLDGAAELLRQSAQVNEMIVPKMTLSGMADYSRGDGYIQGDVNITHETIVCDYDRGRMFVVDAMDNSETAGVAFGQLAGEFIRTKVAPELDAFRFARYATEAGSKVSAAITTGEEALAALRQASNIMDAAEAPIEERILFITPHMLGLVEDMPTTVSRAALDRFAMIVRVHPGRFYSGISLLDGKSAGQEAGGFIPAEDAVPIQFLAIHKGAVVQFTKHADPKVVAPAENQSADAWKFGYRIVSIARVLENKVNGVYAHLTPVEEG